MQRTALIKCPFCNNEEYVVSGDLDEAQLIYTCGKCKKEYQVEFFDYCPTCNTSVGFIESQGFKNDMKLLGKTMLSTFIDPNSTWSILGGLAQVALGSSIDANGDACCPICHQRYYRCSQCSELVRVEHTATFEDIVKCSSCGIGLHSRGSVCPSKHSRAFNDDMRKLDLVRDPYSQIGNGYSNDRKRQQEQEKQQKPRQIQNPSTDKLYSRTELLSMIDNCNNGCGQAFEDTSKVDMFIAVHGKKFPQNQLPFIRERLLKMDDWTLSQLNTTHYKDPSSMFLISIFLGFLGIDRFMLENTGAGVGKFLTCGGWGIWWIIDIIFIREKTKEVNFQRLCKFL